MTKSEADRHTETGDVHWIEWVTGIASCLLVGGMIGWITWQAITAKEEPPQLSTTITEVRKQAETYRVEFEILNAAPTTAAAVTVIGEIHNGADIVESSQATFDYVAAQSKSRGALLFRTNPAGRDFRLRPAGYTDP